MPTLGFLQKKGVKTDQYIFMLFLSGSRLYGFAFEEANAQNQSVLYQEPVDPFLKNAAEKVEKIIANCEQDLGEDVYLKKTVLVLNSLYTTESGSIKEDFLKEIKSLLKKVDLDNLGYLNFYEVLLHNLDKEKPYLFVEETNYDFMLYSISNQLIKSTQKITKTQEKEQNLKLLQKQLPEKTKIVAWFDYKTEFDKALPIEQLVTDKDLQPFFVKVYFKDRTVEDNAVLTEGLALAPGFGAKTDLSKPHNQVEKQPQTALFKQKFDFLNSFSLPALPGVFKKTVWLALPIGLLLFGVLYFFFVHRSTVFLQTKKENFSSDIEFIVSSKSNFVRTFQTEVSLEISEDTTGEKVTGEKAKGEVTIYNGLFEKAELESNTELTAENGVVFVTDEKVIIPSATTSANIDEGLVTTAYGKKNVGVTALEIGAEGNIDSGSKLTFANYDKDNFYALSNNDFIGGVKKTVAIFSNKDALLLDKKALAASKKMLIEKFNKNRSESDILFKETVSTTGVRKKYSAEVNDEVKNVDLSYEGKVKVFYSPYKNLATMVEKKKLKEKEFVDGTFALTKIKLLEEEADRFSYSAIAKGQVQNFIDKKGLTTLVKGKLVGQAEEELKRQPYIIDFEIKTGPLPLPIIPSSGKAISFELNN